MKRRRKKKEKRKTVSNEGKNKRIQQKKNEAEHSPSISKSFGKPKKRENQEQPKS